MYGKFFMEFRARPQQPPSTHPQEHYRHHGMEPRRRRYRLTGALSPVHPPQRRHGPAQPRGGWAKQLRKIEISKYNFFKYVFCCCCWLHIFKIRTTRQTNPQQTLNNNCTLPFPARPSPGELGVALDQGASQTWRVRAVHDGSFVVTSVGDSSNVKHVMPRNEKTP